MTRSWTWTFALATAAILLAAVGFTVTSIDPGVAPGLTASLLLGSLACTAVAFGRVAMRVRRLELENEGLIEEIGQEFDRVKDKIEIFSDALQAPRTLSPAEAEAAEAANARRVMVK
jgi:glycine/D-amino acid oxidase-like deaminating enzyme